MTRPLIRSSLPSIRGSLRVAKMLSILFPIAILYPLAALPAQEKQEKRPTTARYEVRLFPDKSSRKPAKRIARAAIAKLLGIRDLQVTESMEDAGIITAVFALPRRNVLDRNALVKQLAATRSHVFYIRRIDQGAREDLRRQTRRAKRVPSRKRSLTHEASRPLMVALDVLRRFRSVARSHRSSHAVTPALDAFLLEIDAHVALLRARGVELPVHKEVVTKDVEEQLRTLSKKHAELSPLTWTGSLAEGAAEVRLIELPAFEHHAATLRSMAKDAAARAKRITGSSQSRVRARARHLALATHARELARIVERAVSGVESPCPAEGIFCQ